MEDENIHVGKLLKEYMAYWKYYVPIGMACLVAAIIFIVVTPPQYEINARMQLVTEENGMLSELKTFKANGLGALLGGGLAGGSVEDEAIIMQSRSIMADAIKRVGYQTEIRTRRGLKHVLLYGDEAPVKFVFPESFVDTISMPVKMRFTLRGKAVESIKIKSDLFGTMEISGKTLPCVLQTPVGDIGMASNEPLPISEERTFSCTITPLQRLYEDLYEAVYVGAQETVSEILLLSYDDESKQRGCSFLNAMINSYNDYSRGVKAKEANLTAHFVKERLDTVALELAALEHRIEVYKKYNNIPDPALYAKNYISGQQELEMLILETEVKLSMLDYIIGYLNDSQNRYASVPVIDGMGEKAIALYNELVLEYQRLALSSEKDNPTLVITKQQLESQHDILLETITATRKSLSASLQELKDKDRKSMERLSQFPTQEREYIEIKRQQKIKEMIFLFLMQKLQEKELVNSPDEQKGRTVDPAYYSARPVYPKKLIVFAVAFMAACILSIVAISIRMHMVSRKL